MHRQSYTTKSNPATQKTSKYLTEHSQGLKQNKTIYIVLTLEPNSILHTYAKFTQFPGMQLPCKSRKDYTLPHLELYLRAVHHF